MSKRYQVLIDGYRALGLEVGASNRSVRTAYRKLMKQWHPDVNHDSAGSIEKAKELNDAFGRLKSLSAGELRALKVFDRSSSRTSKPQPLSRPAPPRPAPRHTAPPTRSSIYRAYARHHRRGRDVIGRVDLTPQEELFGARWQFSIPTCHTCGGWGAAIDARLVVCDSCGGLGANVRRWPTAVCSSCGGRGGHYNRVCPTCDGHGNSALYSAKFHVPPGTGRDFCGLVDGLGHRGIGGEAPGDLYLLVV